MASCKPRVKLAILLSCLAAIVANAPAQANPVLTPEKGAEALLSVTVSRPVVNDEAVVEFQLTRQGRSVKEAQAQVLADLAPAMKAIRGAVRPGSAEFQSGQLQTTPEYAQRKPGEAAKIVSWSSRQRITVKLKDTAQAAPLIEAAQPRLEFSGLRFQVSKAAARRERSGLMAEAMADLAGKAAVIARSLGVPVSEVRLAKVDFGNAGGGSYPAPRLMMKAAASADNEGALPDLAAGETEVELTASAKLVIDGKAERK